MTGLTVSGVLLAAVWSFGASACSAFYFNTEKSAILWGGIIGSVGWVLYTVVLAKTGSAAQGYLAGSFAVALCSELFAFFTHNPATVYLLPGLLPLVPGGGIFYMMRFAVQGNLSESLHSGYTTLISAGAIALGIALASSAARIAALLKRQLTKKK